MGEVARSGFSSTLRQLVKITFRSLGTLELAVTRPKSSWRTLRKVGAWLGLQGLSAVCVYLCLFSYSTACHLTFSGSMQVYAPTLWNFSTTIFNLLEVRNPGLRRHFPGHPLAGMTFNLGPRTRTIPHKDLKNLSWGWCSVTSLGSYDYTKGGHIIFWDLKLIIEFPPYSTIFLPSALVVHSNTEIEEDETRMSITHYSSAGLFSWFAYGNGPKGGKKESEMFWWNHPRHMFSKLEDLEG